MSGDNFEIFSLDVALLMYVEVILFVTCVLKAVVKAKD